MENTNQKNIGIIIIVVLLIVSVGLNAYSIVNKNKTNSELNNEDCLKCECTEDTIKLEMSDIFGLYRLKGDNPDYETYYELFLYNDGTFIFLDDTPTVYGNAGNYYIKGNEIILNNLFSISDGMSIKTLSNNYKDSLTYNDDSITYNKKNITLSRDRNNEKEFANSMGTLYNWLKDGYFINNKTN